MTTFSLAGFVAVFAVLIGAAWSLAIYNGLVAARRECDRAWSNIDVLLKQRYDELPRLVEICRSHAAFERETLEAVVAGRARVADARTMAAQAQESSHLTTAVRNLLTTAESYPALKASESFLRLQSRVTEIEDQIADRRELYNAAATEWNTRLEQIPDVYLARAARMRARPLWRERMTVS
jgi:LemA protein